jgi:excisionase family DNA binding protein
MDGKHPSIVVLTREDLRDMLTEVAEAAARRVLDGQGAGAVWLGRSEVADLLGYKQGYVSELVRRRGLPCHRIGRRMRFRRDEVEAWAEAQSTRV